MSFDVPGRGRATVCWTDSSFRVGLAGSIGRLDGAILLPVEVSVSLSVEVMVLDGLAALITAGSGCHRPVLLFSARG